MSRRRDPEIQDLTAHFEASIGGQGRRSPLFRWLFQRASEFERAIQNQQPSWNSVAAAAQKLKLTDGRGKPPTAERARKTWYEVRRAKGWDKSSQKPAPAVSSTSPVIPLPPTALTPSRQDPVRPQRSTGSKIIFTPIAPTYGKTDE